MDPIEFKQQDLDLPVFSAWDMLDQRWRRGDRPGVPPPQSAILSYQPGLLRNVNRKYSIQKIKGFFGDLYLFKQTKGKVAISGNFGVGAPSAVMMLEELAAFGVRQYLSIGLAGGLQTDLTPGSVVVSETSKRGEGTSYHYLPPEEIARPHPELTYRFCNALDRNGIPMRMGATWSTDAPYREMRKEVEASQRDGLLAVDMETAALFAAGKALGVQVSAAFVISDSLVGEKWLAEDYADITQRMLQRLVSVAIDVLAQGG